MVDNGHTYMYFEKPRLCDTKYTPSPALWVFVLYGIRIVQHTSSANLCIKSPRLRCICCTTNPQQVQVMIVKCECCRSWALARERRQDHRSPTGERKYNYGVHARERRCFPSNTDPGSHRRDLWSTGHDIIGWLAFRSEGSNALRPCDKLVTSPFAVFWHSWQWICTVSLALLELVFRCVLRLSALLFVLFLNTKLITITALNWLLISM